MRTTTNVRTRHQRQTWSGARELSPFVRFKSLEPKRKVQHFGKSTHSASCRVNVDERDRLAQRGFSHVKQKTALDTWVTGRLIELPSDIRSLFYSFCIVVTKLSMFSLNSGQERKLNYSFKTKRSLETKKLTDQIHRKQNLENDRRISSSGLLTHT